MTTELTELVFRFAEPSEEASAEPTQGVGEEISEKAMDIAEHLAEDMGIPTWGFIAIVVGNESSRPTFLVALYIRRRCSRKLTRPHSFAFNHL
jgi:hypothetical protein